LIGTKEYNETFNKVMTNLKLHMAVRVILLCSVMFFSTGFTTIVKYCSMSQSSECCCESDHSDNAATQTNEPSVSDQNSPCLTVKVIGGLNDIKATVTSEISAKLLTVEAIPSSFETVPLLLPTQSLSFIYTDDIAPPNEDICIRISSLLI
jgi:hypothetical protein